MELPDAATPQTMRAEIALTHRCDEQRHISLLLCKLRLIDTLDVQTVDDLLDSHVMVLG